LDSHYVKKTALHWNPKGYRRRGRPKRTCRRTTEDEIRSTRRSWDEVKGDSWRPQCLEALHGCPILQKQ